MTINGLNFFVGPFIIIHRCQDGLHAFFMGPRSGVTWTYLALQPTPNWDFRSSRERLLGVTQRRTSWANNRTSGCCKCNQRQEKLRPCSGTLKSPVALRSSASGERTLHSGCKQVTNWLFIPQQTAAYLMILITIMSFRSCAGVPPARYRSLEVNFSLFSSFFWV